MKLCIDNEIFDVSPDLHFNDLEDIYAERKALPGQRQLSYEIKNENGETKEFCVGTFLDAMYEPTIVVDANKSFLKIFNEKDPMNHHKSAPEIIDDKLQFEDFNIQFFRTIRIPDDDKIYPLPPDMGTYQLYDNNGKFSLPMYFREAMWMMFSSECSAALKIGIGDINVITGLPWSPGVLTQNPQNYVCIDKQDWLDGIKVDDVDGYSMVRQFIAMTMNDDSTIEKQLVKLGLSSNSSGLLKFEVFYKYKTNFKVFSPQLSQYLDKYKSLADYGLPKNSTVLFESCYHNHNKKITLSDLGIVSDKHIFIKKYSRENFPIYIVDLTGKKIKIPVGDDTDIYQIKKLYTAVKGYIPFECMRFIFAGKQLDEKFTIKYYNLQPESLIHLILDLKGGSLNAFNKSKKTFCKKMSLSAGGLIKQKIYSDQENLLHYNVDNYQCCCLQLCNSSSFPIKIPPSPITYQTYIKYGYPWFDLYDENIRTIERVKKSHFSKIKSISNFKFKQEECCICMEYYNNILLAPCGHCLCQICFDKIVKINKQCPLCRAKINVKQHIITSALSDIEESCDSPSDPNKHIVKIFPKHF